MDATRRLREPAAWLLLAVVFVATVAGIVEMLNGLFEVETGGFQSGAIGASSEVSGVVPAALPFFAVVLATKFGPVLERARLIVIAALGVQGFVALIGLIAWIGGSFGALTTFPLLLSHFLVGALWLAVLGVAIFYSILMLKLPELAPKPKPQPAPQQGYGQFPGGQYPGAPGGYPGMQPGPQMGQTGQQQPYGPPPGQPGFADGPQPGYPSGQQAPMPGYQPQEYGQPDSTYQMPSVGEPEPHNLGAPSGPQQPGPGFASGPQPGYPAAPSEPSGPQFAPPPGPGGQGGQGGQPGWPGGYGQPSGPQPPQSPPPGPGWPGGFGQEAPQTPDSYGQGGFGQPGPSGPGAFGQPPEAPSPYQEPPSPYQSPPQYDPPAFGQEPAPFGGTPEPQEPQEPGPDQQNGGGFDALFGGRPDADEPDDVQRTSRIEHDPEAFRRYQPPPGDQQ